VKDMTDTPRRRGRPATGTTPLRNFRIKDAVYGPAKEIAQARGESLTDVVESALSRYVARHRDLLQPADARPMPISEPCDSCQLLTLVKRGTTVRCENPDCPSCFGAS
jgi:hypothetical protein